MSAQDPDISQTADIPPRDLSEIESTLNQKYLALKVDSGFMTYLEGSI